jgi:hypothetical protein
MAATLEQEIHTLVQRLEAYLTGGEPRSVVPLEAAPKVTPRPPSPLTPGPEVPVPQQARSLLSVPLPISPTVLAQSLIAAREQGISALLFIRQTVTVPANGSAQVLIPVAPGNVMIVAAPIRVVASVYSSQLTATLVVDGVNLLLNNFPLTFEASESMPEYGVIRSLIDVTLTNGTASPIEVTYDAQTVLVASDYYNSVMSRFLELGANAIRQIVDA